MSQWYYHKAHGLIAGPFSDVEIREHRESGAVRDTTFIWRSGWSEWTTFADIWTKGAEPVSVPNAEEPPSIPLRLADTVVEAEPVTPNYLECTVCHESWPENLLFSAGRVRMCAKCLKIREQQHRRKHAINSGVFGVDVGTSSWLLKLVFAGLALAGAVILSLSLLGSFAK
jgi:hypothetical protein